MIEHNLQNELEIDLDSFVSIKSVFEFIEHLKQCGSFKERFNPAKEFEAFEFDWLT